MYILLVYSWSLDPLVGVDIDDVCRFYYITIINYITYLEHIDHRIGISAPAGRHNDHLSRRVIKHWKNSYSPGWKESEECARSLDSRITITTFLICYG